jgi:hypothetical protein
MSPPLWWGDILVFFCSYVRLTVCPSVRQTVCQRNSSETTEQNFMKLVGSKDTICSCAYYQEILIPEILWELYPFELKNFPKYTSEAACQRNSSETTEQNFMKLGR